MKKFILLLLLAILIPKSVLAQTNTSCDNRYLTLVNPVRGRSLWGDNSLKPFQQQLSSINSHNFSATWLLQYDAVSDPELASQFNSLNQNQEKGVLLEVSEKL